MIYRAAALVLGVIVATYWGRVLRMAHKARKKTGRAGNIVPAERVGRLLRFIWAPVVIVWAAHPFVTSLVRHPSGAFQPFWRNAWAAWAAAIVAAGCFAVTRVCWKTMGASWRMGIDAAERTSLVVAGPFARVRHPIYALSQAMMIATVIAIPSPLLIAAGVLHVGLMQWEAAREEKYLLQLHGSAYGEYCRHVGRFIPSIRRPTGGKRV